MTMAGARRGLRRIVDLLQRGLFDPPEASTLPLPPGTPELPAPVGGEALHHPQATREALLDGRVVAFRLVRVRRRSIGFVVDQYGLTVRAAQRVTLREIDAAVQEKRAWIVARLAEQRERTERAQATRIVWRDGTSIDYLGDKLTVVLDPARVVLAAGQAALLDGAPPAGARRLAIGLPRDASAERIQDAVQSWLQREARRVFAERAAHFAARLGVRVRRLSLSSAATRWGSANANGSVRLHWRLIEHPLATIDYVVAHELAHLREMNHGPRFWQVVESVLPDYREARSRLRRAGHTET
ncbi:MAG TPA: SprT family zinc-dependent metalloprotease [Caldimonas sp.]